MYRPYDSFLPTSTVFQGRIFYGTWDLSHHLVSESMERSHSVPGSGSWPVRGEKDV